MAAAAAASRGSLREDLTCAICCDLFREPVMLACMHHFCRVCISRYWRGAQGPVSCPQCRKEFDSKHFQTNYLVAAMVEKIRASLSDSHAKNLEKELQETLDGHRLAKADFINSIRRDKDSMETIKRVGEELQARVKAEFRALHHILHEQESRLLEQLCTEQQEELDKVQRHLEAVETAVSELEQNVRALQKAAAAAESAVLTELPQLRRCGPVDAGPRCDVDAFSSRYAAPLQYMAWRKMFQQLKPGPAPLTFDADTAHPSIRLSRDGTEAVEWDGAPLPAAPPLEHSRRFAQCVNVLACQGFQSGRHYWEVEVGSKPKWDLGVASEAVDRGARIKLSPDSGYWTLRMRNGDECSAGTQPWTRLRLGAPPRRVGVFLDCEERRVSFYNADDMSLLYSFAKGPRGKVFPFFSPCIGESGQRAQPIRLLHHPAAALSC